MKSLITGASRGIGFALTVEGLKRGETIFAIARNVEKLKPLERESQGRLKLIEADVSLESGRDLIVREVTKSGELDTLINNAGVLVKSESAADFELSFHLNTFVPFEMFRLLLPVLKKSKQPRVAQISTMMSSIEDNGSGGYYWYRSSKSALNMVTKSLTVDHPEICFSLIHPGWVKTDMGGSGATVEPADSAKGIWDVIAKMNRDNSGVLKDYRGQTLPW